MSQYVIETRQLTHHFGAQPVLKAVNLQVPAGSIYGFLGPNGAGKTTTLRLLLGLLRKQQGEMFFFGQQLEKHRIDILRRIGSLIEQPSLYLHLTGRENLRVYSTIYQCAPGRVEEVLELVGLAKAANKKAKQYSLGMKQRLAIGIGLLNNPDLLILDEPTNGLDPAGIIEMRELLQRLNQTRGVTVVVSSHLLSEIEKFATHVGIIHYGALLFQGTLSELQHRQKANSGLVIETNDTQGAAALLQPHFNVLQVNGHSLTVDAGEAEHAAQANKLLVQGGIKVYQLYTEDNSLETLFMEMTNTPA